MGLQAVTHEVVRPGIAVVTIAAEPVNTMTLKLWHSLMAKLDELEADPAIRAAVFVSGLKRDVFTAGNDIMELYAPRTSLERYREFWVTSNDFLARLYCSSLFTIAAIRGACPAGGCCLSMCCDVRLMSEQGHIGLNEVALGIAVPPLWAQLMGRLVGVGAMERLCSGALLVAPQTALEVLMGVPGLEMGGVCAPKQLAKVGLLDEVVPKDVLLERALQTAEKQLALPDAGRVLMKSRWRDAFAAEWAAECRREPEANWAMLTQEATVNALGAVLKRLAGNKKAKL